jgi:hypothetical protein
VAAGLYSEARETVMGRSERGKMEIEEMQGLNELTQNEKQFERIYRKAIQSRQRFGFI